MQKQTKRQISRSIKTITLIASVLLLGFGLFLVLFDLLPRKEKQNLVLQYSPWFTTDYLVHVNESDFYNTQTLEKDGNYITAIVNKIIFDLGYNIELSDQLNFSYTYDITGRVVAEYKYSTSNTKKLWEEKIDFGAPVTENMGKGTFFNKNRKIELNYSEYNKKMEQYQAVYNLPINAYIEINANVKIESDDTKTSALTPSEMKIKIPLLQPTFEVEVTKPNKTTKSIWVEVEKKQKRIQSILFVGIGEVVLGLILLLVYLKKMKKPLSKQDFYYKELDLILKKYAPIIVKTENNPITKTLKIINIKFFDDLIDLEEELKSPILFYVKKSGEESHLIIISKNYAYKYVVNVDNYEDQLTYKMKKHFSVKQLKEIKEKNEKQDTNNMNY